MVNIKQVIEAARIAGISIGETVKNSDGSKYFRVGRQVVRHHGKGGARCWSVNGKHGYIGEMAHEALAVELANR